MTLHAKLCTGASHRLPNYSKQNILLGEWSVLNSFCNFYDTTRMDYSEFQVHDVLTCDVLTAKVTTSDSTFDPNHYYISHCMFRVSLI